MESIKDKVCSFENLYKALKQCKKGVMWKDSVAGFYKNGLVNCYQLERDLMNDKYKLDKYIIFNIYEPKKREIVSTRIKDRVFQRSLCDNYFEEQMQKSFIYDNCACQKGKGTSFARKRLQYHLQKHFRKYGLSGHALKCDIKDFFGSTSHETAYKAVCKRVPDPWVRKRVKEIIDSFNHGSNPNVGMGLGSQVTQIIQLAVLDDLDHFIKEKLHIKHYVRYMDDFILIHESKEYLKKCKEEIEKQLNMIGLRLSIKKTQIFPITQPIKFLGFSYRLTETGRVVIKLLRDKISHERRKLSKQVSLSKQGVLSRFKVDQCFQSWKSHASFGNNHTTITKMETYYNHLWEVS